MGSQMFSVQTGVLVQVSLLAVLQDMGCEGVLSLAAGAEGALIQHFLCPFLALLPWCVLSLTFENLLISYYQPTVKITNLSTLLGWDRDFPRLQSHGVEQEHH